MWLQFVFQEKILVCGAGPVTELKIAGLELTERGRPDASMVTLSPASTSVANTLNEIFSPATTHKSGRGVISGGTLSQPLITVI